MPEAPAFPAGQPSAEQPPVPAQTGESAAAVGQPAAVADDAPFDGPRQPIPDPETDPETGTGTETEPERVAAPVAPLLFGEPDAGPARRDEQGRFAEMPSPFAEPILAGPSPSPSPDPTPNATADATSDAKTTGRSW